MLMETNERAPLLSDVEIHDTFMYGSLISDSEHGFKSGSGYARNFYEAKITSGELMVVKTAVLNRGSFFVGTLDGVSCSACNRKYPKSTEPFNFCPGCGAKIIDA